MPSRSPASATHPLAVAILLLCAWGPSNLHAGTVFELVAHTFDSGGRAGRGMYVVETAIGQPDADPLQPASAGVYELVGGFLPSASETPHAIDAVFGDGFEQ